MNENGEPKRSITGEALSLLEDQMELASLELDYERKQSARRLGALLLASFLALTAFAVLQVALIRGLEIAGLSLPVACIFLAAVYGGLAAVLVQKFGTRDKRAGEPFEGTRQEIRKNLKWIRQILS